MIQIFAWKSVVQLEQNSEIKKKYQ